MGFGPCGRALSFSFVDVSPVPSPDVSVIFGPVPDPPGSAERPVVPQKRRAPSPTHSSNGHSPSDTSPSPIKKKKKPGAMSANSKDQVRGPVCSNLDLAGSQIPEYATVKSYKQ